VSPAFWVQHTWLVVVAAAVLFAAGLGCLVFSRTLVRVLIGSELLVKSTTLLIVLAGAATGRVALAEALVVVLISLEVVGVAVAAGIVVGIHRHLGTANTDELAGLRVPAPEVER
jgi:NADH:ubiquinone oxidoreductase subunit K